MLKRTLVWTMLVLSGICVIFAALLIRPADVWEMLVGFAAGTLGTLQWGVLAIALVLLAATAPWSRSATTARRVVALTFAVCAVLIGVAVTVRDYRGFSRDVVSIKSDSVTLQATVYHPRGTSPAKRPAILLLHGSGDTKRDAYHLFARRFADLGLIVLNADKRGIGGSTGRYYGDDLSRPVIQKRTEDARAALDYLAHREDVDTSRIGVFAISQGGWIVPQLLDGSSPARFAVVFAGVTVSSREEGAWSEWTGENSDHFGFKPPLVPFDELDSRMKSVPPGDFNPRAALAQMNAPSLWLFGEWDSSAPTAASLRVIDTLKAANVPITTKVFPEANHGLMIVRGPRGKRGANFTDGVWNSVREFLDRNRAMIAQSR